MAEKEKEELEKEEIVQKNEHTNKTKEELKKAKEDLEEITDRYKRILAEFENFKKRSQKEREGLYHSISSDMINTLLPVIDNLEKAVETQTKDENYKMGVAMVLKQLQDFLKAQGVEEIQDVGQTFDPELHEAISSIIDTNYGEKEITQAYRKGYKIGNKIIRHSLVVVAN